MPRKRLSLTINQQGDLIPAPRSDVPSTRSDILMSATAQWGSEAQVSEGTVHEWAEYGANLGHVEQMVQWEIGDWWLRGERFGERVDIVTTRIGRVPRIRHAAIMAGLRSVSPCTDVSTISRFRCTWSWPGCRLAKPTSSCAT